MFYHNSLFCICVLSQLEIVVSLHSDGGDDAEAVGRGCQFICSAVVVLFICSSSLTD